MVRDCQGVKEAFSLRSGNVMESPGNLQWSRKKEHFCTVGQEKFHFDHHKNTSLFHFTFKTHLFLNFVFSFVV